MLSVETANSQQVPGLLGLNSEPKHTLAPRGCWYPPDLHTNASSGKCKLPSNQIAENPHRCSAWLDLLAPVAPLANGSQRLLALLN